MRHLNSTSAVLIAALGLAACSTAHYTEGARSGLQSQIWMLEARPQQGQTADQTQADWTACEGSVTTAQGGKGYGGSGYVPVASYVNTVTLYKNFERCMKERGYVLAERGK